MATSRSQRLVGRRLATLIATIAVALLAVACGSTTGSAGRPDIVVTFPVLGALVEELVGETTEVRVLMGNGVDPHDWAPSAKDIEAVQHARLVIVNGLDLEEGLAGALAEAERSGTPVFAATDHATLRRLDGDGADDPHLWVDPLAMAEVVDALTIALLREMGIDRRARSEELQAALVALDADLRAMVATIEPRRRVLVTGHESLGYLADRYGFELLGSVVQGTSSQAESSAAELETLRNAVEGAGVEVIFTEIGESDVVAHAIAAETGARLVPLHTHTLPADGTYRSFLLTLIGDIVAALAP